MSELDEPVPEAPWLQEEKVRQIKSQIHADLLVQRMAKMQDEMYYLDKQLWATMEKCKDYFTELEGYSIALKLLNQDSLELSKREEEISKVTSMFRGQITENETLFFSLALESNALKQAIDNLTAELQQTKSNTTLNNEVNTIAQIVQVLGQQKPLVKTLYKKPPAPQPPQPPPQKQEEKSLGKLEEKK